MKHSNSIFTANSLLYNILLQMQCLVDALGECGVNMPQAFLNTWTTNSLDGAKDVHVSPKILQLVGKEFREWQEQYVKSDTPTTIRELMKTIT